MICFAWSGFPQYAARSIGELVKATDERVVVVATRPKVPIQGMERVCGCEVKWIEENDSLDIDALLGEMPRVLIEDGWFVPAFNAIRDAVRKNGGKVIGMSDNDYQFGVKTILSALRFRLLVARKYDQFFVPGRSGKKLMRFYGVRDDNIKIGMYAADDKLFYGGQPLAQREKRIVCVGQLCDRKNVVAIATAFSQIANAIKAGWTLSFYGSGPLRDKIPSGGGLGIEVHDFMQPEELAELYRNVRVFILGSKEEHWGLVVHEAALSGCYLLLSHRVGAAVDFLGGANGVLFDPFSVDAIRSAMVKAMRLSDGELCVAEQESLRLAQNASNRQFVESVLEMVR